ncbi:HAD-IA family hydrolase [Paraglaciecola aquimarina]|uniref:HAD-IA family hydrolase n=1 Tax=Paraglaciecola aquimarina TaxID=1235557 RepID=A0ABU3SXA7_9ALTE|nr:HAD-IA family hydrolase [Paraglaciecola aquimarina]MDU0354639.1 HAD-IA family hydrolase [Paraglaciecola aquimarina]
MQTTVGLEDILSQLNVKSCVATSGSPQKVKHSLGVTGLDHFFKAEVFTSSEVKNGKPAPDLFLHAARQMGVKPENCLVIEDSTAGIKGAQAANMPVIRYAGASHLIHHVSPSGEQPHHNVDVPTISHWRQLFELIPAIRQG